jgi:hypothetical protein
MSGLLHLLDFIVDLSYSGEINEHIQDRGVKSKLLWKFWSGNETPNTKNMTGTSKLRSLKEVPGHQACCL